MAAETQVVSAVFIFLNKKYVKKFFKKMQKSCSQLLTKDRIAVYNGENLSKEIDYL